MTEKKDTEAKAKVKDTDMLVIENTQPRLIELPNVSHPQHGGLKEEHKRLIPGENDVPAWAWEKAKKIKANKIFLACKYLVSKGVGVAKKLSDGLDNLSVVEAKRQIAKCEAVDVLKAWKGQSKKADLKKACDKRIDEIVAAQSSND